MTDEQLIDLVRRTPAEDLTLEQIELLRERMAQSPALRDALIGQLTLEQYLGDTLAQVHVSVDKILGGPSDGKGRRWLSVAWWLAGLGALAGVALVAFFVIPDWRLAEPKRGANSDPTPRGGENRLASGPQNTPTGGVSAPPEDTNDQAALADKTPSAEAVVQEANEPWAAALAAVGEPPAFEDVCFDDFPADQRGVDTQELSRWLIPVEPPALRVNKSATPVVTGLVKLRAPFPPRTALRLSLDNLRDFQIHVFSGVDGVTLRYYPNAQSLWAAYRTVREAGAARPKQWALVATDNDRYRRLGAGTFELRHGDGRLVLSRGDVMLLTAPLPAEASDVYFEGAAAWRGVALTPSQLPTTEPEAQRNQRPLVLRTGRPAKMAWRRSLPRGATLDSLSDGGLRLSSQRAATLAWCALPVPDAGLYEVMLLVEKPTAGAGVYLGDGRGARRIASAF